MTQSFAINTMLRYIGELPVPEGVAIDDLPEGHEAVIARTVLEEVNSQEQEIKYWFNSFTQSFIPSASGYITIPYNVISLEGTSIDVVSEGNDLYNVDQQTKIFTEPVELDLLIEVKFEDLPQVFQTYVVLKASKELHMFFNGDEVTQNHLQQRIQEQYFKVDRENLKQSNLNLIRGRRLINRTTNPTPLA